MKLQDIVEASHISHNVMIVPITPQNQGDISHGDWGFTPGSGSLEEQIAKATAVRWEEDEYWREMYDGYRSDFHGLKKDGTPSKNGPRRDRIHKALIVPKEAYEEIYQEVNNRFDLGDIHGGSDSETYAAQAWIQQEFTKVATDTVDLTWPPLN